MSDYDVYIYGYYSPRMGHASDLNELSTKFAEDLLHIDNMFANYQEIDFITHSMGGLVTKGMLVQLNNPPQYPDLQKVRCVIYISVPSSGASVADVASWFSRNPQFKSMTANESNNYLQAIDGQWRKLLNQRTSEHPFPRTFSAYETLPTDGVKVVPSLYTSQLADSDVIAFDYNHISIVKPDSRENDVYKWARANILNSSNPQPETSRTEVRPPDAAPALATHGAPLGSLFEYSYSTDSSVVCHGEYVKISATQWYEKHADGDPQPCLVNAVIFTYTERESADPNYFLLYDSGRHILVRLTNSPIGDTSPDQWRYISSPDDQWNVVHTLTRKK
jgi:pimeloyl-ACP methyl ester carboxylesterase